MSQVEWNEGVERARPANGSDEAPASPVLDLEGIRKRCETSAKATAFSRCCDHGGKDGGWQAIVDRADLLAEVERLRAHMQNYALLRAAVNESADDCSPECDSYGHAEGCKTHSPARWLEDQQREIERLRATLASASVDPKEVAFQAFKMVSELYPGHHRDEVDRICAALQDRYGSPQRMAAIAVSRAALHSPASEKAAPTSDTGDER